MLNRRRLHQAALAWALAAWAARPARATELKPRFTADPFGLGVASGQPRPDGFVLWTRLDDESLRPWLEGADSMNAAMGPLDAPGARPQAHVSVRWEVFADEALRQPVRSGSARAWAHRGFSVHVPVSGLEPGRSYFYRFSAGAALSRTGRARTAPADGTDVQRLRLALASCQHYEQGLFTAHADIAAQDLDLVLFVGDYIYESTSPSNTARQHGARAPLRLSEYRERHALYKRDADLQACHAAHTWVMTWDDHEVINDYAGAVDQAYTEPALFLRRRAAAYRAYFEHMPLLHEPQGPEMRIHQRLRWGQLAELWTLDCRQYRSLHACPDPLRGGGRMLAGCDELADPARSMLGSAQEAWLRDGLLASRTRWRLLGQSTQVSSSGLDTPVGRTVYSDGWDGYPRARERLLEPAASGRVDNLLCLGGDVHRHVAAHLRQRPGDERSPVVASEFVASSITSRGASRALMDRMRASNPDVLHARGDERGYALVEITPQAALADFRATAHPVVALSRWHSQARFAVRAGAPGVVPA